MLAPQEKTRRPSVDVMFGDFDRERFGVQARQLEILLAKGAKSDTDALPARYQARKLCHQMCRDNWLREPYTVDSSVWDLFPARIAWKLEGAGLHTLDAAQAKSDADLLAIDQIDQVSLRLIRSTYLAVITGRQLPRWPGGNEGANLEPDWPPPTEAELSRSLGFQPGSITPKTKEPNPMEATEPYITRDVDMDLTGQPQLTVTKTASTPAQLPNLISHLLTSGPELLHQIDTQIVSLEDQLDQLRQARKVIGSLAKKTQAKTGPGKGSTPLAQRTPRPATPGDQEDIDALMNLINKTTKPQTVVDLSRETGLHHMRIRSLIAKSEGRLQETDGIVVA